MMAAASAVEEDPSAEVLIVERNPEIGRKVVISGGGRCNLTTSVTDVRELMGNYPRGEKWLKFVMHEFGPAEVYRWFEDHGIELKTEGKRVFPKSNDGNEVIRKFRELLSGVEIKFAKSVTGITRDGDGFRVEMDDEIIETDKVILTTGGQAYTETGSTGDGYEFAKALGHTVTPLTATLTSLLTDFGDLAGVAIEKAKLKLVGDKKYEFTGPFLFTHKGVTGPAVFALSAFSAFDEGIDKLYVDFVPDKSYDEIGDDLTEYVPKSLAKVMLDRMGKKSLNKKKEMLKNFEMKVVGRNPGTEIVTAGGVSLKEVDPKTMESKIIPGLYFAGELLDVDGLTGGFNLQIAWATGRIAGLSSTTFAR